MAIKIIDKGSISMVSNEFTSVSSTIENLNNRLDKLEYEIKSINRSIRLNSWSNKHHICQRRKWRR